MESKIRPHDDVHYFMEELICRVVAESGRPGDRFHLGKLILQSFKDAPDFVLQIDGATGDSETFGSTLERSVKCAEGLKRLGLGVGDVIVLMAPNHIDLSIPFYAAMFLGIGVSAIDRNLGIDELKGTFTISEPKVIFCQSEKAPDIQLALNEIDLNAAIISFDSGDYLCSLNDFLEKYGGEVTGENFEAADFDPAETVSFLISTSGTTGLPKAAAVTQKNFSISLRYVMNIFHDYPSPIRMSLVTSPLQWLTALMQYIMAPIFRFTRLQTSAATVTREHCYHLINTYQPDWTVLSPTFMTTLMKQSDRENCDFSCLKTILMGGSAVPPELIEEIREVTPEATVLNIFGLSEFAGISFSIDSQQPIESCGRPAAFVRYRLIDVTTGEDIFEPNTPGELWLKGPSIFKGYYNNPNATNEAFADGDWFKTGDMFYRDEHNYFYFVERIKLMLKYLSHQISPVELEGVIRRHPGVLDVAVTGIPDRECGDLPVACVVRKDGSDVTAQEIKDLVRESLVDSKQLRGGVIFLSEIPVTATTKVDRRNLKTMVLQMKRE